ncbi:MAG: AAA family ATPase [Candidatus Dormibacteraeota bacterium]|nr:AAA family ATPase [Candidatus Dormibacteraeota bacterium]
MIIFWILAFLLFELVIWVVVGALVPFFIGPGAVLATPVVAVLFDVLALFGVVALVKRELIMREQMPEEKTTDLRTRATNRQIFWSRLFMAAFILTIAAFALARIAGLMGVSVGALLGVVLPLVLQGVLLMPLNFFIFFGPFLLFSRMGRQTLRPGDANYGVDLADVRGQRAAVDEMKRILKLMEGGRAFVRAGGKRERGVLLVGPPGTGKTMLAKGIATSMQMPIITSSGSAFQGMFLGMDLVAVWTLVRAAKKLAKRWGGCTVFIDEFDALGQRRGGAGGQGGAMGGMFGGGQLGLNMLLVQMDGVDNAGWMKQFGRRVVNVSLDGLFVPSKIRSKSMRIGPLAPPRYNLFFMGATNRPEVLDPAVTRAGRFGRQIRFEMPSRENRKDIASLYFDKKAHDPDLDRPERREEFARVTEGFSPADIDQALSMALMYAFEEGRKTFNWDDLREALVNVSMGLAKTITPSEWDLVAVARHEMGHAVAAHFYEPQHSPVTLSIRPRADFLGVHVSFKRVEHQDMFRSTQAGRLRAILAALATERVFYGENTAGVTGDLRQATSLASHMIGVWGMGPDEMDPEMSRKAADMGETLISRVEVTAGLQEQGTMVGTALANPISRRMVAQVMGAAYIDAWRLIFANRDAVERGAETLVERREMVGAEIELMLNGLDLRMFCERDPYPEDVQVVPGPARSALDEDSPAAERGVRSA